MRIREATVLEDLRERIRGFEGSRARGDEKGGVSTGFADLDRVLAGGGLSPGTLTEWVGDGEGSGAATLALAVGGHILRREGVFVVMDDGRDFYPVSAAQLGVPLERTVVVRPDEGTSTLWAWEQTLRCPGVAVTFGRVGAVSDRVYRRLQLAIEAGGGLGFLVRTPECHLRPAWAATRVYVTSLPGIGHPSSPGRRLRVRVTRGLRGDREPVIEVELGHETCDVPVVPELARPVAKRRATGG